MTQHMTYEEAVARLRNHSNVGEGADDESMLYALWKADRNGSAAELSQHVASVLACLAVANRELNGQRPSETIEVKNPRVISEVAYPVSGLIAGLLRQHRRWSVSRRVPPAALDELRDAALRFGKARDMVIACHHDNLIEELEIEWNAAV